MNRQNRRNDLNETADETTQEKSEKIFKKYVDLLKLNKLTLQLFNDALFNLGFSKINFKNNLKQNYKIIHTLEGTFLSLNGNQANKFSNNIAASNKFLNTLYDILVNCCKQIKIPGFKKLKIYKPQIFQIQKNLNVSQKLDELLQLISWMEVNHKKIRFISQNISYFCILSMQQRKMTIKKKKSKTNQMPKSKKTIKL